MKNDIIRTFALSAIEQPTNLPNVGANQGTINVLLQVFFGIVGALAILFVVIGGFRYIISNGDPKAVEQAKKTILYAAIGLFVAISGEAVVTYALKLL